MKKISITVCALLLTGLLNLRAQDDKSGKGSKTDKPVLEEQKNGGKTADDNNAARKLDNNSERQTDKQTKQQTEKKEMPKYDKKPH